MRSWLVARSPIAVPGGSAKQQTEWCRSWRQRARTLTILVAVVVGAVTPAHATARGKRPPQQVPATSSGQALGAAPRAVQPSAADVVSRPDSACHPRSPALQYHGGALVQNPDVFILFWGSEWDSDPEHQNAKAALVSMYQNIGTSDFACEWREYAVPGIPLGAGTYNGSYVIETEPPSPLDDSTIQLQIQSEITAGHAPDRTDDRVYVVVPTKGVPVLVDGVTGCGGSNFVFCGYHDSFGTTAAPFRYVVLPFPCTVDNATCFVDVSEDPGLSLQVTGSHELTELVTDPDSFPIDNGGWYSPAGYEAADICAGVACIDTVSVGAVTFDVNPTWSNLAKACVTGVMCAAPPLECTAGSPGICVPGSGKTTACELEWLVDPNLTLVSRTQLPGRTITCTDGQTFCDADDTVNSQCLFQVAGCLNSQDPRVSCTPASVSRLTLTAPSAASKDPVSAANAATLLNAFEDVDPSSVGAIAGNQITYAAPAATLNACTNYLGIAVPAGKTRKVAVTLQTSAGLVRNQLRLRCVARLP